MLRDINTLYVWFVLSHCALEQHSYCCILLPGFYFSWNSAIWYSQVFRAQHTHINQMNKRMTVFNEPHEIWVSIKHVLKWSVSNDALEMRSTDAVFKCDNCSTLIYIFIHSFNMVWSQMKNKTYTTANTQRNAKQANSTTQWSVAEDEKEIDRRNVRLPHQTTETWYIVSNVWSSVDSIERPFARALFFLLIFCFRFWQIPSAYNLVT